MRARSVMDTAALTWHIRVGRTRLARAARRISIALLIVYAFALLLDRLFPLPLPDPTTGSTVVLARQRRPEEGRVG
jgi:hypothetical protein